MKTQDRYGILVLILALLASAAVAGGLVYIQNRFGIELIRALPI